MCTIQDLQKLFLHWTQSPILSILINFSTVSHDFFHSLRNSAIYKEDNLRLTQCFHHGRLCEIHWVPSICIFRYCMFTDVLLLLPWLLFYFSLFVYFIYFFHKKRLLLSIVEVWVSNKHFGDLSAHLRRLCVVRKGDEGSLRPSTGDIALFFHFVCCLFTWTYHLSTSWPCLLEYNNWSKKVSCTSLIRLIKHIVYSCTYNNMLYYGSDKCLQVL